MVASADGRADYLTVLARDAASTGPATQRVLSILRPQDPTKLIVETPQSLAPVQQEVADDLGDFSRGLLLGVLTAGASLIAVIVLADVLLRRADLGRRRALGATRTVITLIVAGRVIVPAVLGAGLGSALGVAVTTRKGATPPPVFVTATAVLACPARVSPPFPCESSLVVTCSLPRSFSCRTRLPAGPHPPEDPYQPGAGQAHRHDQSVINVLERLSSYTGAEYSQHVRFP